MEAEKKPKKRKNKSKKLPIIIISVILALLLIAGGVFYFLFWRDRGEQIVLSDAEFLMEIESWEKIDAPTVIWVFRSDGAGELTTNKSNYYDILWTLESGNPEILNISTDWLYILNDSFEFELDRDGESFTVKNLSDDTESTFVPLGTQAASSTE